jgi:hypothetical protein
MVLDLTRAKAPDLCGQLGSGRVIRRLLGRRRLDCAYPGLSAHGQE